VEDCLPAVRAGVGDETVASGINSLLRGELACDREKVSNYWFIFWLKSVDRIDMLVWHDQDVCRCNGVNIAKGCDFVVVIDDSGRPFVVDDLAKNATGHVVISPKNGSDDVPKERRQKLDQVSAHKRYHNIPTRWLGFVLRRLWPVRQFDSRYPDGRAHRYPNSAVVS